MKKRLWSTLITAWCLVFILLLGNQAVFASEGNAPIPPGSLKLEPCPTGLRVTWVDRSDNEDGFQVEKKKDGLRFEPAASQTSGSESVINTYDWGHGAKYIIRVKAYNSYGASYSEEVSLYMPNHTTSSPQFFSVQNVAEKGNRLYLSWEDTSDNEDGFFILRRSASGSYVGKESPTAVVGKNVNEYYDDNLDYDTDYMYQVYSFNLLSSTPSTEARRKTGPTPPEVQALAVSNDRIKVTWTGRSDQTDYYRVDRKEVGEAEFRSIKYSRGAQEFIDQAVVPSRTYIYRVAAGYDVISLSPEVTVALPPKNQPFVGKKVIKLNLGQTAYRVNDEVRQMDTAPFSQEGRTMLPIRYVTEPLGATLDWDGAAQKVTVKLGNRTIELWIGNNTARVNGREVLIDPANPQVMPISVPPGRAMLPLRFISENLGCQVGWNQETQEASLTYSGGQ
ncbi:MAG: hypothetical protein HPY50_13505 [Firmicutes bacterium]|nr:hypothetical protein [Bacillota bacterium]